MIFLNLSTTRLKPIIPTETDENGNPIETEEGSTDNTDQRTEQSGEESSNQSVEESASE